MLKKLRRHWKWILPTVIVLVGAVVYTVFSLIKGSEPYGMAMDQLRQNEAAVQLLGEPVDDGFFPTGSVNTSGPSGVAELAIPVSGSRREGKLYVQATKEMGTWTLNALVLAAGSKRLDLTTQEDDVP